MGESPRIGPDQTASLANGGRGAAPLGASLNDLRAALLELKPTGSDGFEGLLARVLGRISGKDFRLAKSGLQNGQDGATAATTGNHISFECKLYDTKINDNDVLAKITQLIGNSSPPDVWVLASTVGVSTQLQNQMQSAAEKIGISTLVLDWPSASAIPPLAAACAFALDEASAFLRDHVRDSACVQKAEAALATIRDSEALFKASDNLVRELRSPSLGLANAKTANAKWLEGVFADRALARAAFGQVLAPSAAGPLPLRQRSSLVKKVQQHLMAAPLRKMVALVGGEGSGKSWLLAQSWLELDDRPLLVVIPANDLEPGSAYGSVRPLLVSKLIQQTGESDEEIPRKRWERRLQQWKDQGNETSPRFVLSVDGLNQKPGFDWPRWLDEAADAVEQLGGALLVTVREGYFDERIRTAVHSEVILVRVPEWTEPELREILAAKTDNAGSIKPAVFARLRNPRILGIAFDLLDLVQVHTFDELSVERLLFEHIRIAARDGNGAEPPDQFSKRLAKHAQEILDRVRRQQGEDRLVFDRVNGEHPLNLSADLLAVTAEHFFQSLREDSTLYTVTDDGLSLALGLAIIKALQKAERNKRSVLEALDELVEPIAALDKTADAVFSAVMVSSVDEQCSLAIQRALIFGFLRLQNIDAQNYAAFTAVVRKATNAAIRALFDFSAAPARYAANKDWLSRALRECRREPECWEIISAKVSDCLRSYSLDPKIGVMSALGHDSADEVAKDTQKKTDALEQRMAGLSAPEREFLKGNMLECKGYDPSLLWEDAFEMLAGMPLSGFAEQLVACSFARALNSSFRAPYDEYFALIRFNRRDWQQTRRRLLEASDFLGQQTTSGTGKWALVAILRGISTVEDADREEQLLDELVEDREKLRGWRLVEQYCATDPCDPTSIRPDNIDATADRYAQVNVDEVSRHRFMGADDRFVMDALPGLARFVPEVAIATIRRIAQSIVARGGEELVYGVPSLEPHCAALDSETVGRLAEIAKTLGSPRGPESTDRPDGWIGSQYAILIAFPHLSGDEQLDLLTELPCHEPPLLELGEVLKPASPEKLEWALAQARQSAERNRALTVLSFARRSGTALTGRSLALVAQFLEDERSSVRAEAMDIIAHVKAPDLIEMVISKGWSAALLDPQENRFEIQHGSQIVIKAAEQGMLSADEALDRISPRLFGVAAQVLGPGCHQVIATRLAAATASALETALPLSPPAVEQDIQMAGRESQFLISLTEPEVVGGPESLLKDTSGPPDDFEARQRGGREAFNRFETAITREHSRLIVEDVGFEAVDAFVSTSQDHCVGLAEKLLRLDDRKLMHVQNVGLMLARSISRHDVALARKLFDRLSGRPAFVNIVYHLSGVSLEADCVWMSADGGALDVLRAQRLDRAMNDHEVAQEVLAALMAGKSCFLEQYSGKNLESPEPAVNARALMVIGFGAESAASDALLSKHAAANGLIGKAGEAARFAYNRNRWARHWFEKLCATASAEEFWTLSALFLKIVDARFALWGESIPRTGAAMPRFESSIRNRIEKRVKAWKAKREQTLCGDKAPDEVYLTIN